MNTRPYIYLHLFAALFATTLVNANPQKSIRYAVTPFPPWVIDSEELTGIDIEIGNYIAAQLGRKPEYLKCPFARCLKMMETGTADAMLNLFYSQERAEYIHYFTSAPLSIGEEKIFYLASDRDIEINTYEQLYELNVGVIRGTKYFTEFDLDENIVKVPVVNDIQLINMLLKHRVEAVIGTEETMDYIVALAGKTEKIRKAKFHYQASRPTLFGMSLISPILEKDKAKIDTILQSMHEQNKVDMLTKSFWERHETLIAEDMSD